jgi:hypothetical protein
MVVYGSGKKKNFGVVICEECGGRVEEHELQRNFEEKFYPAGLDQGMAHFREDERPSDWCSGCRERRLAELDSVPWNLDGNEDPLTWITRITEVLKDRGLSK